MIRHLSVEQIVHLHADLAREFGGASGIRDRGALEAAAARPAMTFAGEDLYPDLAAKAAALMHSLIANHPFLDANKRVGAASAELFVEMNGARLEASDEEFFRITMSVAKGDVAAEALAIWFGQRLVEDRR